MSVLAPRKLRLIAVSVLLLLMAATRVGAVETITAHGDVNLTATITEFDADEIISSNNTVNWTADVDWVVTIESLDANLGQSDDVSYTKLLSDLQWKLSSNPTWTAMTTTQATVTSGSVGGGSGNFDIDYKFLLSWANDKAGSYGATVQFTISAQ